MSASSVCWSDSGRNATRPRAAARPGRTAPLLTASWSAPAREPSSSCSTSLASEPARSAIVCTALRRSASASLSQRLASVLANPCTTVIGVRNSWLVVARNRSLASSSSLAAVTSRKSSTCSSRPSRPVHSTSIQRPLSQPVGQLGARARAAGTAAACPRRRADRDPGEPVRRRVPLPDQAVGVQHRDAVGAGVDHRALVRPLPDDLLERGDVGQGDAGVPGQQLEQLQLDMADLAPAVQRVQGPVRPAGHVRQAERDRVQPGQRRPDQVVEAARLAGGHQHRLAGPHQLADRAAGQVGGAAAQARRAARPC